MKFFNNLSTRSKLFLSFGLVWLIFLVVIILAYRGINDTAQIRKDFYDVQFKISNDISELRANQNMNRALTLEMIMETDKSKQLEIEKQIDERGIKIDNLIDEIFKLETEKKFLDELKELKLITDSYRDTRNEQISLIRENNTEKALLLSAGIQAERFKKIDSLTVELDKNMSIDIDNLFNLNQQQIDLTILIFIILSIVSLIFSVIIVIVMTKSIAQPLNEITEIATRISEGDLNVKLTVVERKDEVGILLQTFSKMINVLNKMANAAQQIASGDLTGAVVPQSEKDILGNAFSQMLINLRQIMKDISEGVNLLGSSASEILAATTQVASGAAESATAISETTATVEEVRQAAQLSSQKASNVSDNAQQVVQITKSGEKAVNETMSGMHDIQKQMEAVANTIVRLSEQSQQIGGIIASVTDVADQSNLLAVNAAIEAAKAGEHGKGFAVVAQEIKSLAQQSKQSTIQVRNILNDVQKATSAVVMATEQTSKSIENGVKQSNQAGDAIKKLADSTNKAVEATLQIVASSNQQLVGMDQIGLAMQNINQAGTENAASMVQAEKAAKGLHELGQKLELLVKQYKIKIG